MARVAKGRSSIIPKSKCTKQKAGIGKVHGGRVSKKPNKAQLQNKAKAEVNSSSSTTRGSDITKTPSWRKENFDLLNEIGSGGYASVYLAKNKSRLEPRMTNVVLKIISFCSKRNVTLEDGLAEYSVHQPLQHPNITSTYGYFATDIQFTLIMDYCDKGDLHDYIYQEPWEGKSLPKQYARSHKYIRQVVSAVEYLHTKQKVIHMDIKPENVLVASRDMVKLTDFGCCVRMTGKPRAAHLNTKYNGGTMTNHPPELLRVERIFDSTVDVWAIGCLTYVMMEADGDHPFFPTETFKTSEDKKIQVNQALWSMENMRTGRFNEKGFLEMAPNVQDFIRKTLGTERKERPLVSQLRKFQWLSDKIV